MAKPGVNHDAHPFYRCLRADCTPIWREGGLESARRHIVARHDPLCLLATRVEVEWGSEPDHTVDADVELTSLPGRAMFIDGRA